MDNASLPPISFGRLIRLSFVDKKSRRWIIGGWLGLVILSALGVWSTLPYRITSARFEFLANNFQTVPQVPLGKLTNGNILLSTASGAANTAQAKQLIQWNPKNKKYYRLNGQEYAAGSAQADFDRQNQTGLLDQRWFNDFSYAALPGNIIVSANGADVLVQKLADTKSTRLEIALGSAPLVVGLSDTEVLLAGDNKAVSNPANGDGASNVGTSKLYRFNIATNKLTDTGKTAPTIFGSEARNQPVVYDAGQTAIIWTMKGDLWRLDKRSLAFRQVARSLTQENGQQYNQMIALDKSRLWISPPLMNLGGRGYVYDMRSDKVSQHDFEDGLAKLPSYQKNKNIPYLVYPVSHRLVLFMPSKEGSVANKMEDVISGRLAYDIPSHHIIPLNHQFTGVRPQADTADRVILFRGVNASPARILLTATGENIDYTHGLITRPWWWSNPANQIGMLATLLIGLLGAILLVGTLRAQMRPAALPRRP
jgi:hypothetical protein